jgi:hypothetical protein
MNWGAPNGGRGAAPGRFPAAPPSEGRAVQTLFAAKLSRRGELRPRGLNCGTHSLWARSPVVPLRVGPPLGKTEPGISVSFYTSPSRR